MATCGPTQGTVGITFLVNELYAMHVKVLAEEQHFTEF